MYPTVALVTRSADLGNTLGAFLIGVIISAALYGITVVQTYQYFRKSEDDPRILKFLVSLLGALDTTHEILMIQTLYQFVINEYGNPSSIARPTRSLTVAIIVEALMGFIIKSIFCHRLWKLGTKPVYALSIVFFSIVELVCSIVWVAFAFNINEFDLFNKLSSVYYVGWVASLLADVLIASSQVVMLWKRRTGFNRTDTVVRTLMMYSINTGLLTSIVSTIGLITFASMPDTLLYVAFYHQLSGLLLNAFLATYNARHELRQAASGHGELVPIRLSHMAAASDARAAPKNGRIYGDRKIQIAVDTSTNTQIDG